MKLSSVLMVCSGIINAGIAGIFYYFTLMSYLDNWLHGAGWQIVIGTVFTVVSIGTFRGSRNLNIRSTASDIVLMMVALGELFSRSHFCPSPSREDIHRSWSMEYPCFLPLFYYL